MCSIPWLAPAYSSSCTASMRSNPPMHQDVGAVRPANLADPVGFPEETMKIQILGSGCTKCKLLEQHAREAVAELGVQADVEKVTDMEKIAEMGVMMT
ncbi:MAG: thioredoxin family protein, partial [Rectinemataceae bacterium]